MPKSTSFANSLLELVLKATTFADFAENDSSRSSAPAENCGWIRLATASEAFSAPAQRTVSASMVAVSSAILARMAEDRAAPAQDLTINLTVPEREVVVNNEVSVPEREVVVNAPVDARTTVAEGAVRLEPGAVQVDAPVTVPEREVNITLPPGGGTKRVTFSRGLDGKIVGAETKED